MPLREKQLEETNRLGADTREMRVRASDCPALANHHIAHSGIADAAVPYEIVRLNLGGTYMLACFEGRGRIFLDGGWRVLRAGDRCRTAFRDDERQDRDERVRHRHGNPFVFSTTFKKWVGWRPSEYRAKRREPKG